MRPLVIQNTEASLCEPPVQVQKGSNVKQTDEGFLSSVTVETDPSVLEDTFHNEFHFDDDIFVGNGKTRELRRQNLKEEHLL